MIINTDCFFEELLQYHNDDYYTKKQVDVHTDFNMHTKLRTV